MAYRGHETVVCFSITLIHGLKDGLVDNNQTNSEYASLIEPVSRPHQATIFDVLRHDPMLEMPEQWRELQIRDHSRWTRYFVLPVLKPFCIFLIWSTKIIKRIASAVGVTIGSERLLNFLSLFFMRKFVSPEAQEILLRHLALENILVHFAVKNSGATDVPITCLRPRHIDDLGDVGGMNATLLHDTIILNLFVDLGKSTDANLFESVPLDEIDFSMLQLPEFQINTSGKGGLINLDLESSLYIIVLFLVLLFDDRQMESSANSLFLDESLMKILSNLTGDLSFRFWTLTPFTSYLRMPLDLSDALHKHIKVYEHAFSKLKQLEIKQRSTT